MSLSIGVVVVQGRTGRGEGAGPTLSLFSLGARSLPSSFSFPLLDPGSGGSEGQSMICRYPWNAILPTVRQQARCMLSRTRGRDSIRAIRSRCLLSLSPTQSLCLSLSLSLPRALRMRVGRSGSRSSALAARGSSCPALALWRSLQHRRRGRAPPDVACLLLSREIEREERSESCCRRSRLERRPSERARTACA